MVENSTEIREKVEIAEELALRESGTGYLSHLQHVIIDAAPEAGLFRDLAYSWQWEDARIVAPALEAVTWHRSKYTGPRNFWFTRHRGADKTTSLARAGLWMLAFTKRTVSWVHAAADAEQAALLMQAMARELELNPWLARRVSVSGRKASGVRQSHLEIVTSDAASAFGALPDLISVDELVWWRKPTATGPKGGLWGALWSARDKRPHCVVWAITNAGMKGSWQHKLKLQAEANPRGWYVWDRPGRLPTWMSEEDIKENRKLLPPSLAKQVIDNLWLDPGEESGFLTRPEVDACDALGKQLGLIYTSRGTPSVEYVLVLDYGPKRDRTTLGVYHQDYEGRVLVDRLDVWQGSPSDEVPIKAMRDWIEDQRKAFGHNLRLVVDPYQLLELAQDYERRLPVDRFEARGGKGNYEMAEALRTAIVNRRIAWYPGCGTLVGPDGLETLTDELVGLVLRSMPYGYRFDHQATGHDDRSVNLGMAVVALLNRPKPAPWKAPPDLKKVQPDVFKVRQYQPRGLYGME